MYEATDFIKWALTHAQRGSIPADAELPLPPAQCGTQPWHYLFGTVKVNTDAARLEERWQNYYSKNGWTKASYDAVVKDFKPTEFATDCQGLLDAWLTEQGEKTDINSNMNYSGWCSEKGLITELNRPYVLGEAVFRANSSGKMVHVGFICGTQDGEPLVVEARGLRYGTVVSRLSERSFTHRGLMTAKFSYAKAAGAKTPENAVVFKVTTPLRKGDAYRAMQAALNAAGYSDSDGKRLDEDGKWGKRSMQAFQKLLSVHTGLK